MRRNRTIYLLAAAACLVFSIAYKSRISAVLLCAVAGYFVIALLLTFANLLFIKAGFSEERGVYEKNTPFEVSLFIANRFIAGCAPVELICTIPDRDTGTFSGKRIYASLPPLGKCRISITCMHKFRGSYTARIERIAVCDPLRIIRLSRRLNAEMTQVFLPRKIELGSLFPAVSGERTAAVMKLLSGEKEEFSHVREYKDGDTIQLVHWKLTAKNDELMMKQFEEAAERRALILCDFGFDSSGNGLLMRADGVIETAIAFAMSAADAGIRTTVDFGAADGGFVSEIRDRAGFDRFYELMSVLPAKLEVCGFTEMIRAGAMSGASMVFMITSRLTEEVISAAEQLAEISGCIAVLAFVNISDSGAAPAEDSRLLFLNIRGDGSDALQKAAADLSDKKRGVSPV